MLYDLLDKLPSDGEDDYLHESNSCPICQEQVKCTCASPPPRYSLDQDAERILEENVQRFEQEPGLFDEDFEDEKDDEEDLDD